MVVDLKTSRAAPTGPGVKGHVQLGLYQYAVDSGAVDELVPEGQPAASGGAELVQLGLEDGEPDARVQRQEPAPADGAFRQQLRDEIGRAAGLLRAESFPAIAGPYCRECSFVPICPIKSAGSVTDR